MCNIDPMNSCYRLLRGLVATWMTLNMDARSDFYVEQPETDLLLDVTGPSNYLVSLTCRNLCIFTDRQMTTSRNVRRKTVLKCKKTNKNYCRHGTVNSGRKASHQLLWNNESIGRITKVLRGKPNENYNFF